MTAPDHDAARWGRTPPGHEATNTTAPEPQTARNPAYSPSGELPGPLPPATADGITHDTAPEHAHSACEQANEQAALRQRLAEALNTATWGDPVPCAAHRDHGFYDRCGVCTGDLAALAEVCAAVVQPELDQHWADLACRTNERDQWREEARRMHQNCDHWRKRAEAAEAALATQNAENDRLDQLLIDERAITARLNRELGRLRDQNGHQP